MFIYCQYDPGITVGKHIYMKNTDIFMYQLNDNIDVIPVAHFLLKDILA